MFSRVAAWPVVAAVGVVLLLWERRRFFFWLCGLLWIFVPVVIIAGATGAGIGHTYLVAACVWTAVCLVLMIGRFRTIHHARHYDVRIDHNHYTETTWHGSQSSRRRA